MATSSDIKLADKARYQAKEFLDASNVTKITNLEDYIEITNSEKLTVAFYYNKWSGPCRSILPVFLSISDYALFEKVQFVTIDCDENENINLISEVVTGPLFKLFRGGEQLDVHIDIDDDFENSFGELIFSNL